MNAKFTVAAVVISVAVPGGRNAAVVVGAAEAVAGTRALRTGGIVFVGIVAAVVVSVAQPVGLHTNVGRVALEVVVGARGVADALVGRFIRRVGVFTVVDSVAHLSDTNSELACGIGQQFRQSSTYLTLRDAALVGTGEFSFRTGRIGTSFFVRVVSAVILVIALPRLEDAASVSAPEFDGSARVEGAVAFVLVGIVSAVVVAVARPQPRDALAVGAVEFGGLARVVLGHAHPVVVDQFRVLVAAAFRRAVDGRETGLRASAVVECARIELAALSFR